MTGSERTWSTEARALLQDFEPEVREGAARLILRLARAAAARSGVGGPACCPPDECDCVDESKFEMCPIVAGDNRLPIRQWRGGRNTC